MKLGKLWTPWSSCLFVYVRRLLGNVSRKKLLSSRFLFEDTRQSRVYMSKGTKPADTTRQRVTPAMQSTTKDASRTASSSTMSDVERILRDLVLFFCRRIIFAPALFKIIVYFLIIIVGSFLSYLEFAPSSYLASKGNIFNTYFVKLGWAWTIGLLLPFVYLNLLETHTHRQIIMYHLTRLLIATGLWYVITSTFVRVENYTSRCEHEDFRGATRKVCIDNGHKWKDGYDFSGHSFLLIYAVLIINEEVKAYAQGLKVLASSGVTSDTPTSLDPNYRKLVSVAIPVLYVLLAVLTIIWEMMLLSTALYFHYFIDKVAAAFTAIAAWGLTYRVWYRDNSSSVFSPSSPKGSWMTPRRNPSSSCVRLYTVLGDLMNVLISFVCHYPSLATFKPELK